MRDSGFLTWPEMKEHMHYVAWLFFSLISFPAAGHAAVLVLCVSVGEYVDHQRLLLTVLAAAVMAPAAYAWRKFGERHCRFAEFDETIDRCLQRTGSGYSRQIESLVTAIERASGMERQLARNEAKQWLQVHAVELSEEERELVSEHLGYLWRW
jgi:hypothetical protein